jgi:hypothetical protein
MARLTPRTIVERINEHLARKTESFPDESEESKNKKEGIALGGEAGGEGRLFSPSGDQSRLCQLPSRILTQLGNYLGEEGSFYIPHVC